MSNPFTLQSFIMKKTTAVLQLLCAAVLLAMSAPATFAADLADLFFTDSVGAVVEVNPAGTRINVNLASLTRADWPLTIRETFSWRTTTAVKEAW
jgi:hypothetical protein